MLTDHDDAQPFVWTAAADDILAKVARGRVVLHAVNNSRDTTGSWKHLVN